MKTELHKLVGGSEYHRYLYKEALEMVSLAMKSNEVMEQIVRYTWQDQLGVITSTFHKNHLDHSPEFEEQYEDDIHGTGQIIYSPTERRYYLDNMAIYNVLVSGWDPFHDEKDGDIDVSANLYYRRFSSAIGYMNIGSWKTYINTKYFVGDEDEIIAQIAGNIIHEYMHVIGFVHAWDWNYKRDHSVPYAIGNIVEDWVLEHRKPDQDNSYEQVCYRYWWFFTKCEWVKVEGK